MVPLRGGAVTVGPLYANVLGLLQKCQASPQHFKDFRMTPGLASRYEALPDL